MNIRNARIEDLRSIVELGRESPMAAQWSEHTYKQIFASNDNSRITLVAEKDRGVAGFLLARVVADECELEDIVVSPAARRCGVGSELIRSLLSAARARDVRRIFLEVRESNSAARDFYEKCGFAVIGHRPAYYHLPSESALLYALELS